MLIGREVNAIHETTSMIAPASRKCAPASLATCSYRFASCRDFAAPPAKISPRKPTSTIGAGAISTSVGDAPDGPAPHAAISASSTPTDVAMSAGVTDVFRSLVPSISTTTSTGK